MKTLRGKRDVSRVEALSDAVFGFSATLLVVSLEVPATFSELLEKLHGFLAFALSFAALLMIWSIHNAYFRRYALQDRWTLAVNSSLLFVILFYVYPLKFVARGISVTVFGVGEGSAAQTITSLQDLALVFVLYGLGFIAIFGCFGLMYRHAYTRRLDLELSAEERIEAGFLSRHYFLFAVVGLLSVILAWFEIGIRFALPGWIYGLLGPVLFGHSYWSERRQKQ